MNTKELSLHVCMSKIHHGWKPIFKTHKAKFISAMEHICEMSNVTPDIQYLLETFMVNPNNVKVVIIGQDPYPKLGDANGLCFSTNASVCPASLKNVLKAIGYEDTTNKYLFDFHNYLYQGVLLLNVSLTTEVGVSNKHTHIWKNFVKDIIADLTKASKNKLTFMLWGNDAKKIKECIYGDHTVLEYTHPSPMSDNNLSNELKFMNCDHFAKVPEIYWRCLGERHTIYTDGAVRMAEPCTAAYGIYFGEGILAGTEISGKVKQFNYKLLNDVITPVETESCLCTAQRGEYLALCYALKICLNINLPSPIKIVSDSRNALMTMKEWYAKKKDKTKFGNYDLVAIMCGLFDKLISLREVELVHINSHQTENGDEGIRCNYHVDRLAKAALNFPTYDMMINNDNLKYI